MFEVITEHDLPFYFICRRAGRIQRVDLFLQAFFARLRRDAEQRGGIALGQRARDFKQAEAFARPAADFQNAGAGDEGFQRGAQRRIFGAVSGAELRYARL